MKLFTSILLLALSGWLFLRTGQASSQENKPGLFEKNGDVGAVKIPGSIVYDQARKTYTIAGGGENMWATTDAFHFVWRRMSGDLSLAADIQTLGTGGNAHRKAVLIIRQSLDPDNVEITQLPLVESALETIAISSKDRRVVYTKRAHFEAPNWSRDGKYFLFNQGGRIYKLPVTGGEPQALDTGFATRINNDHGISPDGTRLVISDQSQEQRRSLIYVLPITGGTPRRVTQLAPSYWHGWSPDGKTLAYCADRNGNYDIYTIPVEGGEEKRLTTANGLDDGPDYSHDGQYIYFNSERTVPSERMQIWRMRTDGSEQAQITNDEYNNWFPHPSPDGKWIVFLSYEKDVKGHPANKDVMLRLMPVGGGEIQVLAKLFGGQGTINVPSWSPDSRQLAFVSYRLIEQQ